ncbi:MAG TPA: hypothetical protein VGJ84_15875 [Polyangiaceae bacterium]|jgi:hypothetical protein
MPNPGCPPIAQDPECQKTSYTFDDDPLNLRCWDQKRRFGLDLLYPVSRYVEGLSSTTLKVKNPSTGTDELVPKPPL